MPQAGRRCPRCGGSMLAGYRLSEEGAAGELAVTCLWCGEDDQAAPAAPAPRLVRGGGARPGRPRRSTGGALGAPGRE